MTRLCGARLRNGADQAAYTRYNDHPDHVAFVRDRWVPEVEKFLEIDDVPRAVRGRSEGGFSEVAVHFERHGDRRVAVDAHAELERLRRGDAHPLRDRLARHHDSVDDTFYGWNDVWLDPQFRT